MGQPSTEASQPKLGPPVAGLNSSTSAHRELISVSNNGAISGTALLILARVRPAHWPWSWSRLAFSRWFPDQAPGLKFIKTLGSGRGGGFGLAPSASYQGLFCLFDDVAHADQFVAHADMVDRYRQRSDECLTITLQPANARGSWDGVSLQSGLPIPSHAPIAALTRASIRPGAAAAFWRYAPAAQAGLASAAGCELAIGLGEAPLLRQATFSLWDNAAAMDAYARTGAHEEAIRAAWRHTFFSESMFVRFAPLSMRGTWNGRSYG
ncbi:MAG: spheroidene monooxygenase [Betaproteobacteria bacterium]|nr:spheroidene monooxygenase [Betaproteobacteria bacterium]